MKNKIAIVICTANRADSLSATLASLEAVEIPDAGSVRFVVVDNGSTDHTPEVIRAFVARSQQSTLALHEAGRGKSKALNKALQNTTEEILLFSDDDLRFPRDWVTGMCEPIVAGRVEIVQGGVRWAPHLLRLVSSSSYLPSILASTPHKTPLELQAGLIGANMALSRSAINAAGGFDEDLGPGRLGLGEETLVGWQLSELGFQRELRLAVEVEHHFDGSRLTQSGIFNIAEKKGRTLAHIQHHWEHRVESHLVFRKLFVRFKELLRLVVTARNVLPHVEVPEWRYSYRCEQARLDQLGRESTKPRKYDRRGLRCPRTLS